MIIVLNNKSNLTKQEFSSYIDELEKLQSQHSLIICPTYLNIATCNLKNIFLGSQNVSAEDEGAFTGEISASQLKSFGVKYTIVGHSERRTYQKETSFEINRKIKKLLEQEITPILCIGETLQERENNQVADVLKKDLEEATYNLTKKEKEKIIIAYEPVWAIGTNNIPTKDQIDNTFKHIKKILPMSKILYGGSVNENNVDTLKKSDLIDGYLLGGLSLKPKNLKLFLNKIEN